MPRGMRSLTEVYRYLVAQFESPQHPYRRNLRPRTKATRKLAGKTVDMCTPLPTRLARALVVPARRRAVVALVVASPIIAGCSSSGGADGSAPVFGGCYSYVFCSDREEPPADGLR